MNIKSDRSKKSTIDSIKGIIYKYRHRYQPDKDEDHIETVSEGDLYKKLRAIRFRYRLFTYEETFLKILTTGFIFLLVATIYRHFFNLSANIQIILITIPIIFAIYTIIIAALWNQKSWDELVKIIDCKLGLKDRLITGIEFSGHYKKSKLYNTLITDTINLLNNGNVKKNLNQRISKTTKALLSTVIILVISALLLPRLPFHQAPLNADRVALSEISPIKNSTPPEPEVPIVIEEGKDHESKQIPEKDKEAEQLSKEDTLENKDKAVKTNLDKKEGLEKDVDQIIERILSLLNKLTGPKDKEKEQTPSDSLLAQADPQQGKNGGKDTNSPDQKYAIPVSSKLDNADNKIGNNQSQQPQDNPQGQNQPDRDKTSNDGNKTDGMHQRAGSNKDMPGRSNTINNMQEKGSGGGSSKETGSGTGPTMGDQQVSGNGQAQDSNPIAGQQASKGLNSSATANEQFEAIKSDNKQTIEQKERIDNNTERGGNGSSDENLIKNDIEKTGQIEPSGGGKEVGTDREIDNKIKQQELSMTGDQGSENREQDKNNIQQEQTVDQSGANEHGATGLDANKEPTSGQKQGEVKEEQQLTGKVSMPQPDIQATESRSEAQKAGDKVEKTGDEGKNDSNDLNSLNGSNSSNSDKGDENQTTKDGKEQGIGDKTEAVEGGTSRQKSQDKQAEDLKDKEAVSANDLQAASEVKDEKDKGIEKEGQKGDGENEGGKSSGHGEIAGNSGVSHPEDAASIKKDIEALLSNIEREIKTIDKRQKKQQQGEISGAKDMDPAQSAYQPGGINPGSDTAEGGREDKSPGGSDQQSRTDNKQSFTGGSQDGTDDGYSQGSESTDTGSMASPGKGLPGDGPFAGNKSADKLYSSEGEDLGSIKGKEIELFIEGEQDETASQQRESRTYGTQLAPDALIEPTAPIDANAMLNPEQVEEGTIKNNQIPIEYEKIIKKLYIDKD